MGLIELAMVLAFPGNGLHCFGSPAGTGDLLPPDGKTYITAISVIVTRPSDALVGWAYRTNTGQTYVQIGASGPMMLKRPSKSMQPGWQRIRCDLPPHYLTGDSF